MGRQRNKKISCGVLGGKKHTHTQILPTPVPRKCSVCLWWTLFPLLPFAGSSPSKSLPRCSQSRSAHLYSLSAPTLLGTNISTDRLLWTVKTKERLQAAAAKPVSVTSPYPVFTWEGWNAIEHTLWGIVDWNSFAKPVSKHVFPTFLWAAAI